MTRRDFTRLSALAAAGLRLPAQTPTGSRPIGYAAVGLGSISDLFMRGCARSPATRVAALVTGHPVEKGRKYAALYGLGPESVYTYESFDRLRDNQAVDAVYLGLPNAMHREFTLRAAAAGKHVLCEKPMAISSAECREMIDACKRAHVKLMIAYRCPQDPTHLETARLIQSGAIGELQAFEGAFGFNAPGRSPDPTKDFWRLTKKLGGGGSLLDVGIYPLNAIRFFAREEPASFTAVASTRDHTSGRFAEVEQTVNWTMQFPSGIAASCASSYGATMPGTLAIHGTKGSLELSPAYHTAGIHLRGSGSAVATVDRRSSDVETTHFQLEAEHFAHSIRTGAEPKTPGEEGLRDMLAIEAIYRAAGTPIA